LRESPKVAVIVMQSHYLRNTPFLFSSGGHPAAAGNLGKHWLISAALLAFSLLSPQIFAQSSSNRGATLPEHRFKSGESTMRAFRPTVEEARQSIVEIQLDGKAVAFGTIVEANGLIITKASELKEGKLTCKLANNVVVDAELAASDDANDVALVKITAADLKPIQWDPANDATVGQWVVTSGIKVMPEAVGIVSVPQRKILHKRAIIGVMHDTNAATAKIASVTPGLGAAKAGLKAGDVIVSINETTIKNWEELAKTLRQYREGQTVKLRVQREDQDEFEVSVQMVDERNALSTPRRGRSGFSRQEMMNRMGGELSKRAEGFASAIQHDTVLQPWQCGGPLLNLEGKAIGINIARAGRIASYALPAELVQQIVENLKAQFQTTVNAEAKQGN